ncbi:FAD-dependent oxidoreductase (plasmid) [Agrobacterium vitis]|uniref:NAD(P)/FAD-dependent oxidoreductase n=1 Tax=Agrobacterium vitis TaxID=373 RepID=UPI0013263E11|nr:FAD-dependent oxidoreductase [Agrobacterium vitis]
MDADTIVVGGGVVGAALAFGVARRQRAVIMLDGEDGDLRAARANFGLVWVQGKGVDMPAYSLLSRKSTDLWERFLKDVVAASEMPVDYARPGGLIYCLGEAEYEARKAINTRMHNQQTGVETEMIERRDLNRMLPKVNLGTEVVGASYCRQDGHVNPLQLLASLHKAIVAYGGELVFRSSVSRIVPCPFGFEVETKQKRYRATRVIVAAGLATPQLTQSLGLNMPLHSDRGQLLVTERLAPILPFPGSGLRQTADGTVMIGATKENLTDRGVTVASAATLASRATRIIPALAQVRLVRQWSGFRVMPMDGSPIYAESNSHPGLFAAACHSGVTLAAAHAEIVAPAMIEGRLSKDLSVFSNGRFDVQNCA